MFPPSVPRFCVAMPPVSERRGTAAEIRAASVSWRRTSRVGGQRADRDMIWASLRCRAIRASFQMLRNFLCASFPASSRTIKSVPPANGFHTPGSRDSRPELPPRSRGVSISIGGKVRLSRLRLRLRGTPRRRTRKFWCSPCSGRDFRRGLREFVLGRLGMPRAADSRRRESCPACKCRIARRRAREMPAAPHAGARRWRLLRSCESSRLPLAATGTRQLFTSSPSISTAHAPHSPSPQPSFVPVRLNCFAQNVQQARHRVGFEGRRLAVYLACDADFALQRSGMAPASSISKSTSGVTGTRRMSTPVACAIALAIAGAVPSSGSSPMPFAPAGPRA